MCSPSLKCLADSSRPERGQQLRTAHRYLLLTLLVDDSNLASAIGVDSMLWTRFPNQLGFFSAARGLAFRVLQNGVALIARLVDRQCRTAAVGARCPGENHNRDGAL